MTDDRVHATLTVNAPVQAVFDVLADPTTHAAIDGTGGCGNRWTGKRLTATGQIFRVGMYHENHPNKDYEMANRVEVFDRPRAIAWQPGAQPRHIPVDKDPPTTLSSSADGSGATTSSPSATTAPKSR
jgi:hypothetical protein